MKYWEFKNGGGRRGCVFNWLQARFGFWISMSVIFALRFAGGRTLLSSCASYI